METSNHNTGTCLYCGAETRGLSFGHITFKAPEVCGKADCLAKADVDAQAAEIRRVTNSTPPLVVPPLYRDTDLERLSPKLADVARNWTPLTGKGNLLIHGTTRTGKSRTAWHICKRLHPLPKVTHLSMRDVEFQLAEGYTRGTWHRIVDQWCKDELLFIDDLGKEKTTERTGSILFQLIDERTANALPTIITTNHNGSALGARFVEPETGAAFVARLREFYDAVSANTQS